MKKNVHFVGLQGIGVSSLARYFISEGACVTGSDSTFSNELEKEGVKQFVGHDKENVLPETDLLIYSTAVIDSNPELVEAGRRGIETRSYPQALGEITKKYYTIAVSGTHGKSTTTAMLSLIMIEAGLDPTVIIGTKLAEFNNTNFRKGKSNYLLIEADEFKAALLNFYPRIAVITNIEEDHLDFYQGIDDILNTFKSYVSNNLGDGTLILNKDDTNSLSLKSAAKGKVEEYSFEDQDRENLILSVPGKHNIYNGLAALLAGKELGIDSDTACRALAKFKGSWRRFEEKEISLANKKEIKIINDYAHHPTEIEATFLATKEKYPSEKIVVVFQPHQYERTYRLFSGFVKALGLVEAENLLITDIYTVEGRESEEIKNKVNAELLATEVKGAVYSGNLQKTASYLLNNLQGNEIVVIMGAGDVYKLEEILASDE